MKVWEPCPLNCKDGVLMDPEAAEFGDIPLCPLCGGLGVVTDDRRFRDLVRRIRELRLEFCPIDFNETGVVPPPPCIRLIALKRLRRAVARLSREFGDGLTCLANQLISERHLDRNIRRAQKRMDEDVAGWSNPAHARVLPQPELREAMALAAAGSICRARKMFRELTDEHPDGSDFWLYRARFLMIFLRDFRGALKCLKEAAVKAPGRAQIHLDMARALAGLGRKRESTLAIIDASRCPDADGNAELEQFRPAIEAIFGHGRSGRTNDDGPKGDQGLN
jgi:hypothetical protein